MRLVHRVVEAETIGDFPIGRVTKGGAPPTDQDRDVGNGKLETIEKVLNVGVAVRVDGRIRMRVSRQKLLDAKRVGGVIRADQHDVTKSTRDQLSPAEEK